MEMILGDCWDLMHDAFCKNEVAHLNAMHLRNNGTTTGTTTRRAWFILPARSCEDSPQPFKSSSSLQKVPCILGIWGRVIFWRRLKAEE